MAVKMRLMRVGKKKSAAYRVVIMDERSPRDGRYIDLIGRYDPREDPSLIDIDEQKAIDWLRKGVQPTESVRKILEISGAMSRFKVASGKIHTVPAAPEPPVAEETVAEETVAEESVAEEIAGDVTAADDQPADEAPSAEATDSETDDGSTEEADDSTADADATPDASEEE